MFERRGVAVLSGDEEVLAVLKRVDAKAEKMEVRLGDMNEKLGIIDKKQNSLLEEKDKTIGILGAIKGNTGEITSALTFLKERHRETLALRENYELLSGDVDEIKVKLKAD